MQKTTLGETDPLVKLKEMVGDDKQVIREMLDIFCQDVPMYLGTIEKALKHNDWLTITQTAHTLKSTLSFTVREDLILLAEELQHQKSTPIGNEIPNKLDFFTKELAVLLDDFGKIK